MANNTRVVTYLTYSELFKTFERAGITLLSSSLKTAVDFENQIEYLLRDMNPIEMIQFSSFLNMICQTRETEKTIVRGVSLLEETRLIKKGRGFRDKITFHRENLLNLIGQILSKGLTGNQQLTGEGHLENQQKYNKAILLNNDSISLEVGNSEATAKESVLRDHFIREWPHYYIADVARRIYLNRIARYHYCYETLLPKLEEVDKKMMEEGIKAFETKTGVTLEQYMRVIVGLFAWFLEIPLKNEKNPPAAGQPKFGFDFQNISSFYIDGKLFEKEPSFIKTIELLSKDIAALRVASAEQEERTRDPITGYNQNIRIFFDNPIFKISENLFCIIDLKFVIENVCGGLLWRLRNENNFQGFKSAYGRLVEAYFKFLIENIFKGAKITFGVNAGADAIVEQGDKILIIEFTTEYYRLSSLYNPTSREFVDDAYRLLFNTGRTDPSARGKDDKGKLIKLNLYIEATKSEGKTIIPVLVTENLLGNHDLFNDFDNFYDKEITAKKLTTLEKNPPLFLCLDDLETFWGLFTPETAVEGFVGFAKDWIASDKGPQFHNASSGITRFVEKQNKGEAIISNLDYSNFFSPKNIFK